MIPKTEIFQEYVSMDENSVKRKAHELCKVTQGYYKALYDFMKGKM